MVVRTAGGLTMGSWNECFTGCPTRPSATLTPPASGGLAGCLGRQGHQPIPRGGRGLAVSNLNYRVQFFLPHISLATSRPSLGQRLIYGSFIKIGRARRQLFLKPCGTVR